MQTSSARERTRVLIVEDEPLARQHLRRLVTDDPEIEIVGDCGNGRDAAAAVRALAPDLVLLDIQMPELDGFGMIREVGVDRMPMVIFTTAYDEYALEAFRVHALDYLLKPIDRDRLSDALARAKAHHARADTEAQSARLAALVDRITSREAGSARVAVKVDGRVLFLALDHIDRVEAVDDHVRVFAGRQQYLVRETMSHLQARLPAARFLRVHRSAIVNVDRIREIQPWFQGNHVIILDDGTRVTSGRSYRDRLRAFLDRTL